MKRQKIIWICDPCGINHGRWYQKGQYLGPSKHCATYHVGTCDVCGATEVNVTEPRDYGGLCNSVIRK